MSQTRDLDEGTTRRDSRTADDVAIAAESANAETALEQADLWWCLLTVAVTAVVFVTTFSPSVGFGDAPESVSGINSLGVLHAPGYPTYVLLGRVFTTIVPVGSEAFRVNLFSLVCASLAVGLVFLLARLFGAARFAAALGALAVATSVSFWFNAGFAKHYALSALLVVLAAVLGVSWVRTGERWMLFALGAVIGIGTGASWELMAIMTVALVAYVIVSPRRIAWSDVARVVGTAAATTFALIVVVMVRAAADPEVNWGGASSLSRWIDLARQKDFLTGASAPNGVRAVPEAPQRFASYLTITGRELGLLAIVVAIAGLVALWRTRRRAECTFAAVVVSANVLGAVFVSGLQGEDGITSGIVVGGFLIDLIVVLGVLVAVGTTWLCETAAAWAGGRNNAQKSSPRVWAGVFAMLAIAILLPSLVVHGPYANHRGPAIADNYAQRVLNALPENAVLVVWGYEYAEPLRYRQIVHGDRPDVTIVSGAESTYPWYREQLQDALGADAPPVDTPDDRYVSQLLESVSVHNPVYVDMSALPQLVGLVGLRADGLVAEVTNEQGVQGRRPNAELERDLRAALTADGAFDGSGRWFPNQAISVFQVQAVAMVAALYASDGDMKSAIRMLRDAQRIRPDLEQVNGVLALAEAGDPDATNAIVALAGVG